MLAVPKAFYAILTYISLQMKKFSTLPASEYKVGEVKILSAAQQYQELFHFYINPNHGQYCAKSINELFRILNKIHFDASEIVANINIYQPRYSNSVSIYELKTN